MNRQNRLARAVEALLRDRRPRRFEATTDEAAQLRMAALLRSAHPGAALPSVAFVEHLGQQLRKEIGAGEPVDTRVRPGRRAFLRGAGAAAAAVAAGVGIDRAVVTLHRSTSPLAAGEVNVPAQAGGWWAPVATLDAVRAVPAMRFRAGSVEGVLVAQPDGSVQALSAVCTHMGCILKVNAAQRRLDCPCHFATFSLAGAPADQEYLKPLPRLQSRLNGAQVEVFIA